MLKLKLPEIPKRKNVFILILILIMPGCEKEVDIEYPLVQTGEVSDISEKGAMFHAKLMNTPADEIVEHGFLWGHQQSLKPGSAQKKVFEGNPEKNTFSLFISTTLSPETNYFVKAYVKTKHYESYGTEVSFISLGSGAPELSSFFPEKAYVGDTLVLTGENFSSKPEDNQVSFDSLAGRVIYASSDTLQVIVPLKISKEPAILSVSILNNKASYPHEFSLLAPMISGFFPETGNIKDTLMIVGKGFGPAKATSIYTASVFLKEQEVRLLKFSPDTLLVQVPATLARHQEIPVTVENKNGIRQTAEKNFSLNAPHITGFYPQGANLKDTLLIVGSQLSGKGLETRVSLGGLSAELVYSTADSLKIIVPSRLSVKDSELKVFNQNNISATADKLFSLIAPEVSGLSPLEGNFETIITITGANFHANPESLEVFFGKEKAVIQEISQNQLKVLPPLDLSSRQSSVSVQMNNLPKEASETFTIAPHSLFEFFPKEITSGKELIITGKNFHPRPEGNKVIIGSSSAKITEATSDQLKVIVPSQKESSYPPSQVAVSVEVMDHMEYFNEHLFMDIPWRELSEFPGATNDHILNQNFINYSSFVVDKTVYLGLCYSADFWSFDPSTLQWKKLAAFPGTLRRNGTGFVLNGQIYFGAGDDGTNLLQDWWVYSPLSNAWRRKNDLLSSESFSTRPLAFNMNNKGYLILDDRSEAFPKIVAYSEKEDSWTNITYFPTDYAENYFTPLVAHSFGNQVLIGLQHVIISDAPAFFYAYSFEESAWKKIDNIDKKQYSYQPLKFSYNNKFYLRLDGALHFMTLIEASKYWEQSSVDIPKDIRGGISFQIDGQFYIGLGGSRTIWVYDSSK